MLHRRPIPFHIIIVIAVLLVPITGAIFVAFKDSVFAQVNPVVASSVAKVAQAARGSTQ